MVCVKGKAKRGAALFVDEYLISQDDLSGAGARLTYNIISN